MITNKYESSNWIGYSFRWAKTYSILAFPVRHKRFTFVTARAGIWCILIWARFDDTRSTRLTFFLCCSNNVFERSYLAVKIFCFVGNNCPNRRLRMEHTSEGFSLHGKRTAAPIGTLIHLRTKLYFDFADSCFNYFICITSQKMTEVFAYVERK